MRISPINHNTFVQDIAAVQTVQELPPNVARILDSMIQSLKERSKNPQVFAQVQTGFMNLLRAKNQVSVGINLAMLNRAHKAAEQFAAIANDPGGFVGNLRKNKVAKDQVSTPTTTNDASNLEDDFIRLLMGPKDSATAATYASGRGYVNNTLSRHQDFLHTIGLSFENYGKINTFYSQDSTPTKALLEWPWGTNVIIKNLKQFTKFLSDIKSSGYKLDDKTKKSLARILTNNESASYTKVLRATDGLTTFMSKFAKHEDNYQAIEKLFEELGIESKHIPCNEINEAHQGGYLRLALELQYEGLYPDKRDRDITRTINLLKAAIVGQVEFEGVDDKCFGLKLVFQQTQKNLQSNAKLDSNHPLLSKVIGRQILAATRALDARSDSSEITGIRDVIKEHISKLKEIQKQITQS